ncbi:MAG: PAS domain S-box protein [Ignavibacteria bacterium]|nr:PAS domain S-box protein [Ignavibacteria bacterium]
MHNLESTELLRQIIDNINEAVVIHDDKNSIILFNRKTELLLGLTKEQLLGKTSFDSIWKVIKEDGTDFKPEEHPAVITNKTGEPCHNVIMGVKRSDNSIIWLSVYSRLFLNQNQKTIIVTFYDVSQIIELNKKIEKNNKELDLIVTSLDDVVLEIKSDTIVNGWMSERVKIFPDIKNVIGKSINEVFPEQCVVKFKEGIEKALKNNDYEFIECEDPFNTKQNEWYNVKIFPLKGKEDLISLTITDISQKKKMEVKLKEIESRWKFALEGSGDGIWDWNPQTNEVFYSNKTREMLGYTNDEMPNDINIWREIIHPDDVKYAADCIMAYIEGKTENYLSEIRLRCKNGKYKWILARGKIVERDSEGKPLRIAGTQADIQSIKDKEEDIHISQQKFSNAFKYSGIGKALISPEGKWIEVNNAVCDILGYTESELKQLTFQDLTHPEDIDKDLEFVRQMLNKEIDSYQMEKRYIHKNKNYVWALLTVSLVWNIDGTPRFFISQIQDISEVKKLIMDLEAKNLQLVTTTLDLQQKLKQLEEFNRIVAHNIRGPAGNIKILLNEYNESSDEKERGQYIEYLNQSSEQLLQTLTELMEIIEVKMNKTIKFEDCDLEEIIQKIKNQLHGIIVRHHAVINLKLQVKSILYPSIYLESILFNLINNALKYSKKDESPVINISTHKNKNGDVILEILDNGLGINLVKYGNQVFKLHKVFHPGYDSKGVGLFMTKNQIETFGGTIDIESTEGVGTKFTIKF